MMAVLAVFLRTGKRSRYVNQKPCCIIIGENSPIEVEIMDIKIDSLIPSEYLKSFSERAWKMKGK